MASPKITVVGSLNMDVVVSMERLPEMGETIAGEDVHFIPGGKGANQALACARLTADTSMIGCVGRDGFGGTIRDSLAAEGVDMTAVEGVDAPTGTALISSVQGDNCIVVVAGANGFCTPGYVERYGSTVSSADIVMAQLEIPLEAVTEAFRGAKAAGALTILNPAPARELPIELLRLADYMTPNETEWEVLAGSGAAASDEALVQSLAEWHARYGCRVVVTRGSRGCSFEEEGRLVTAPAPKVRVVDTTGAGDCFNAALAYAIGSGRPLEEAARFAVTAASVSVQTFGAQAGMPRLSELSVH